MFRISKFFIQMGEIYKWRRRISLSYMHGLDSRTQFIKKYVTRLRATKYFC